MKLHQRRWEHSREIRSTSQAKPSGKAPGIAPHDECAVCRWWKEKAEQARRRNTGSRAHYEEVLAKLELREHLKRTHMEAGNGRTR